MLSRFRSLLDALIHRPRLERDMEAEMRDHIRLYADDLARSGVPSNEAERRARFEFGSLEAAREECREARGLRWPDEFWRDLGFGLRMMRKTPIFTLTALLTLALCIGANTAVFSVVNAVFLRPLPYPESDRLALVIRFVRDHGAEHIGRSQTGRIWEIVRDNASVIDPAVLGSTSGVNLAVERRVEYVQQQRVSAGFFHVLGVSPVVGREFTPDEDRIGGPPVTVLSYGLWKRIFDADLSAVGRAVTLRGEPYTIVGVMPAGFQTNTPADLWTPLRPAPTGEGGGFNYFVIARLNSGVTWPQADSQIETIGEPAIRTMRLPSDVSMRLKLIPLQTGLAAEARQPLLIVVAAVLMVLLIGCVNLAGLLLARSLARTREIATRLALGGGRGAVMRQLLTESLLLALFGGAAGLALSYLGLDGLNALARQGLGFRQPILLDARVLLVTAAISLLTSLLFGLVPAVEATRINVHAALIEGGRGVAGRRHRWPRRLLIIAEVALGVVLLISAGLLLRTFAYLHNLQPGFDPSNILTARLSLQDARYATSLRVNHLFDESLTRIRELPGVESAAVALSLPFETALNDGFRRLDGPNRDSSSRISDFCYVTPDYFATLRIPILRGRAFTAADGAQAEPVVIVNESFAKKYLHRQDPVGSHLDSGRIVGVVGDVHHKANWGNFGPMGTIPTVFVPAAQYDDGAFRLVHTWFSPSWIVRASGRRDALIAGMQHAVQSVDPQLPFAGFRTLDEVRASAISGERFQAFLLSTLAGLALLLAAVGIYGLISHSVVERTRELGIRMALGATPSQAVWTAALPGIALSAAGLALGSVFAVFAARLLRSMLWGVGPTDPVTFVAVGWCLLLVAAAASFLPALRVARIRPSDALRAE